MPAFAIVRPNPIRSGRGKANPVPLATADLAAVLAAAG